MADQDVMNQLVGFDFHVGVVGCGVRRPNDALESVLSQTAKRLTVVVCPHCDNPENLGAIVRIGAAFGIDALLLGKSCCDPFSRRVIRVAVPGATAGGSDSEVRPVQFEAPMVTAPGSR